MTPNSLHSFAVIPDSTTRRRGPLQRPTHRPRPVPERGHELHRRPVCHVLGPHSAPNGTAPKYPDPGTCGAGSSAVTFQDGYVDGSNVLSLTLFDAETADLTATLTTGTQTGSQAITVDAAPTIAGIGVTGISPNTTPLLSCAGAGSITCSSSGEGASNGNVLTGSIQLEDQYGNATVNSSTAPLLVDFQTSGSGDVTPGGTAALSIPSGQSVSSSTFSLTRDTGTGESVTLTATLENTTPAQTLTVTLSS